MGLGDGGWGSEVGARGLVFSPGWNVLMVERKEITDSRGRVWTATRVTWDEAEAEDDRFWAEELTPAQRVQAVGDALLSCLKTRGIDAVPRLRRVHRRIPCPWRPRATKHP